jgi:predicted nucleic acid-binding protein/GNAT superfamily N-acetyltransferase
MFSFFGGRIKIRERRRVRGIVDVACVRLDIVCGLKRKVERECDVKVEYIDLHHRFFQDVIRLGKKNASTLGFMPEGGFCDHARQGGILVAHNGEGLIGYLMFRSAIRQSRISIVHLCVDERFRGGKIANRLLDSLKEKYQTNISGISLNCRSDYLEATRLWKKYGFVCKGRVRSRSQDEHYLNKWWYDFNLPDLFSEVQNISLKIKALLDANILIKLRDYKEGCNSSQDLQVLLDDRFIEEIDYYYAPELLNEIGRDTNHERSEKTRRFLGRFEKARYNVDECRKVSDELKSIMSGNNDNDQSDRKQVASAIVSKIPYFITLDRKILQKKTSIEERYDIQIFTPQEFLISIDQLLKEEEYYPSKLKGVTFHTIASVLGEELNYYIDFFLVKSSSEKKDLFRDIVYKEISQINQSKIKVIKEGDNPISFFSYRYERDVLIVSFIRLAEIRLKHTLFMHQISSFIEEAIHKDIYQIKIKEQYFSEEQKSILRRFGFEYCEDNWSKIIYNKMIESSHRSDLGDERLSAPIFGETKSETRKSLLYLVNLERRFFPLKFSDLKIPCYIIPIKSYWAGLLFDTYISSANLFGAEPNIIWNIENVYYRSEKPVMEKVPARILWYASLDKKEHRSRSIIASSYLDEVIIDKPKVLFQKNRRYGVYQWKNICQLCKNNMEENIKALRFSNTEVFINPIRLETIDKIFINNGKRANKFCSPVEVNSDIFNEIYKLGNKKHG